MVVVEVPLSDSFLPHVPLGKFSRRGMDVGSVCLSVRLSLRLSVCPSLRLRLSVCLSVRLSVSVCPSGCQLRMVKDDSMLY